MPSHPGEINVFLCESETGVLQVRTFEISISFKNFCHSDMRFLNKIEFMQE